MDSFDVIMQDHALPEVDVGGGRKIKLKPSFSSSELMEDREAIMASAGKSKGEQEGEREEAPAALGY